jgi:hypothetical protein
MRWSSRFIVPALEFTIYRVSALPSPFPTVEKTEAEKHDRIVNSSAQPELLALLVALLRTGKEISVGFGSVARDANGVGSRFRATIVHLER